MMLRELRQVSKCSAGRAAAISCFLQVDKTMYVKIVKMSKTFLKVKLFFIPGATQTTITTSIKVNKIMWVTTSVRVKPRQNQPRFDSEKTAT